LELRVGISGPSFGAAINAPEGRAIVRQERMGLDVTYDFTVESSVTPYAAAGLGAYHAGAVGRASSGYRASEDTSFAAAFVLGVGARASLGSGFYVLVEGDALILAPRPVVVFANREAGDTGRPAIAATLGLGMHL
jgi:hypothetical protein